MITITLTGEEAEAYIAMCKLAIDTPTPYVAPVKEYGGLVMTSDGKHSAAIPLSPNDEDIPPFSAKEYFDATYPVKTPTATAQHFKDQAAIQDELEAKPIKSFPSITTKKEEDPTKQFKDVLSIKRTRNKPFNWRPHMAAINRIAHNSNPAIRNIQNIINILKPLTVPNKVLRGKMIKEGIDYNKDGILFWRTDDFDHRTKGLKNVNIVT